MRRNTEETEDRGKAAPVSVLRQSRVKVVLKVFWEALRRVEGGRASERGGAQRESVVFLPIRRL